MSETASLVQVAIQQLPGIVSLIRLFHGSNSEQSTDEAVMAALRSAISSSLAKDDAWLAAHPEK